MITLEDAVGIVSRELKKFNCPLDRECREWGPVVIRKVYDCEKFFWFKDSNMENNDDGWSPFAVDKNDGHIWYILFQSITDEQIKELEKSSEIPKEEWEKFVE